MKKLLTFAAAIMIALSGMAQENHKGNGHNKNKSEIDYQRSYNRNKENDNENDGDENDRRHQSNNVNNNNVYNQNNNIYNQRRNTNNNNNAYSTNLPARVRSSFYRDYPNATNVSWSKNSGYWTASFPNGVYRVNTTYAANGQRVNGGTASAPRRTSSTSQDGSVWDKILTKQ